MPPVRSQSRGEPVTNLTTVQDFACANIEEAGYQLGRKLGEGRFSEVVLGKHLASGKEFAVKVVDQTALDEDEEASAALRIEVEVLQRAAKHPHVVALRSVIRTPAATYLVMDLMRGGEVCCPRRQSKPGSCITRYAQAMTNLGSLRLAHSHAAF